jgi:Holliday junction resolvase
MANPNGRKGAAFEIAVRNYLRNAGIFVERLVKNGKHDEGDLVCIVAGKTYILELKNRKKLGESTQATDAHLLCHHQETERADRASVGDRNDGAVVGRT